MKVSLHRRQHHSLPPRPRRSPAIVAAGVLFTTATVALGAQRLGEDDAPPPVDPVVAATDQSAREFLDLRVRAHLRALGRR